ncbi:MAG: hypothetical protein KDE53_20890, partial [Caldilineaceae bacterium]|nr:hypothetical protein [Caldilineaceae bacterium]
MVAQSGLMTLRRPGIYFQEKLPPRQPDLPPLDVAAFVGFAEAGPVDTPVPVEDVDTFRAIFGGDLPVARTVNGELRYASLPAAVAGFFANGGRRCYVVRVTGPNASHSRFYLPGLVACDAAAGSTSAAPVTVDAASPGRWSTTLQLATQLRVLPLSPEALRFDGAGYFNWTTGAGALALESGDLLRIAAAASEPTYLITVTAVDEATDGTEEATLIDDPLLTAPRFQIVQQRRCFETATALGRALGDPIVSPTDNDPIGTVEAVAHLTYQGPMAIPAAATLTSGPGGVGFIVEFTGDADSEPALQPGDLLELTVGAATMPAVQLSLLLAIETVDQRLSSAFSPPEMDSPPAATLRVHGSLLLERNEATASPFGTPLFTPTRVERLRFDLLIQDAQQRRTMISDLGFDATHPRFWGDLILLESSRLGLPPTDPTRAIQAAARYRAMQQPVRDLQREDGPPDLVALAGQLAPVVQASEHYLPLGMGSFFVSSQADTSGRAPLPIIHGTDDLAT